MLAIIFTVSIVYCMYMVKTPWWGIAIFIALVLSDFVNALVKYEEKKDEERNI